jgi:hypothetical protein
VVPATSAFHMGLSMNVAARSESRTDPVHKLSLCHADYALVMRSNNK